MRHDVIFKYVGIVLLFESAFMLIAALISYFNGIDSGFGPLSLSFLLTAILGAFPLIFVRKKPEHLQSKEGYVIVTGAWLLSCFVGMFPYLLWGGEFDLMNAWFESVSGFTTTGATILTDIEVLPKGLLFWRSATQWIGGIGVVVFTLTILPAMGRNQMRLYSVELSPLAKDNFKYSTQKTIRVLLSVYIGMTVLEMVLLKIAGMNWFEAVNHSLTTIATGGFSTRNLSIAAFDSVWIEGIITVFTFLSGVHFGLIFATIIGSHNNMLRSEVVRYYFISLMAGVLLISADLWYSGVYGTIGEALRYGLFQGVSVITTTGFATADTAVWTPFALAVIFFFMLQCACAGSTSGGLKADRILLAFKVIKNRVRQQQHPNAVLRIKLNGVTQDATVINNAMLYIVIYILIMMLGTLINTAGGTDLVTGLSTSVTCLSNVGPGFGDIGSLENYASLSIVSKISSTVLMLLGRLEIFGLIQLFLIKWWV